MAGKEAPVGAEQLMGAGLQDQHVPTGGHEQHRGLMAEGREPSWLRLSLPFLLFCTQRITHTSKKNLLANARAPVVGTTRSMGLLNIAASKPG